VENILLFGQVLVSVALIASVLLQSRGAGLGATFGGDSSVYRSRRGIEKRLFQFTIALGVLFVIFSIASFKLAAPIV
jgi:preprotein translocase subunit SecG